MEKLLFALVAIIFVPACSSQSSSCDDYPCPQYQVIETNQDFEERRYADTNWITTRMSSRDVSSLIGAANRLRAFCDAQKKAGHEIVDGWPALITVVEGDAPSTSLSWFLGPGSKPEFTDTSVTLEHKAAVTIYVRSYSGTPSLTAAEDNKNTLLKALATAGKKFNPNVTVGAHYESYYALNHHNEVWVYRA